MSAAPTEWYWDLKKHRAVTADERGADDRVLGPYATRGEAENWRAKVEQRNDAWDAADDEWNAWPDDRDDGAAGR